MKRTLVLQRALVSAMIMGASWTVALGQLPPGIGGKVPEAQPPDTSACDGKPVLVIQEKYPDGAVSVSREVVETEDGEYIDHGATLHYWPDGAARGEFHFICGVRHGPRLTWYQNGQPWTKGAYYHGQEDGTWTMWYPDGNKSREFTVRRGTWDGLYELWFPDGKKRMTVLFVDGLRQGPQDVWDEEGRLISHVDYVDNVPQPTP
ncbi:MAG: toxin-antitoxin system YwqK family antitoxin [Phycisphaerae bacterium]|nr:toxin-antitoxin system YwqK family antitoxin [Phycisphaerae bacterium]